MATFQLFFQPGWAKDLSAPLYKAAKLANTKNAESSKSAIHSRN